MPRYSFEVESYRASISIWSLPTGQSVERLLELQSYWLGSGRRVHARLNFGGHSSALGRVEFVPRAGLYLVVWLPLAEFGFYYDLLRSERPIILFYETRPGETAAAGDLTSVRLGTTFEVVGEGPAEGRP